MAEEHGQLHRLRGPRSLRVAPRGKRRTAPAHRQADLHQRGRTRGGAANARTGSGRVSHQQFHDERRLSSQTPDRCGRQLYRPGVRTDVPAFWKPGHDPGNGAAFGSAGRRRRVGGHPGDPGAGGDRRAPEREMHRLFQARRRDYGARGLRGRLAGGWRLAFAAGGWPAPQYQSPLDGRSRGGGDAHGYIAVDDQLRTSAPGIWALGDCNGKGGFTHTAYNDFEIVAANLLDKDPRRASDRIPAYALYIDPPLGRAGLTEAEVRKTGRSALVGKRPMTKVGRAVEKGESQGFMKIVVDAQSKEILGAAILGTGGDEAIHSILDVMYARAPYTTIQRAVHIHPTVSELIPTMLGELQPLAGKGA